MAEDWALDVKKYVPDADEGVIAAIVRYCGIALRSRDASLVSFTDPAETDRVRENYLKKKLALTDPDSVLDAAIAAVGQRMSGDNTRNRVTVYYLLADHFGKLGLFGAGSADATPVPFMAAPAAAKRGVAATGWGDYLPLAVLVIGGLGILSMLGRHPVAPAPAPEPVVAVAPAIPEGSGLVSSEVDGAPFVSVYFDTAKTDVAPEIVPAAALVKAYLDSHPGSSLAVSGYNDPRGDAAMNAELSKNRAIAVRLALVTAGIPEAAVALVKPSDTTDNTTTLTNARRVDIKVLTIAGTPAVATEAAVPAPSASN
jgi:outer membrane protein OmpA-like peptidoglycan-associated protein